MLKTFRLRRFLGVIAAILGVGALAVAADPTLPPGACAFEDAGWVTADGGCKDLAAGLVWSASYDELYGASLPWSMANAYCNNLTEGGFSDWRLPRPAEIQTAFLHNIMDPDYTLPPPYIGVDHHLPTLYALTWTSQTKGNKATWGDLRTGVLTSDRQTRGMYTECVRP